jgi:DNA replication protein DnaC
LAVNLSIIASALSETYDNADTILDRLVHISFRIEIKGENLRKKQ